MIRSSISVLRVESVLVIDQCGGTGVAAVAAVVTVVAVVVVVVI